MNISFPFILTCLSYLVYVAKVPKVEYYMNISLSFSDLFLFFLCIVIVNSSITLLPGHQT